MRPSAFRLALGAAAASALLFAQAPGRQKRTVSAAEENTPRLMTELMTWFQDEWALPVDPGVVKRIQAIDWNAQATDAEE